MTGRPYTIREQKTIVDYITEHNVYGETKGRKMWMDFANSKLTNRTWQGLKETFLKRILPDIHNPYYQLTPEQVRSFREGCDVTAKKKNKLELRVVGEDSSKNGQIEKDNPKPGTSTRQEDDQTAGETSKPSKIELHHRSSVETVVLEKCDENGENDTDASDIIQMHDGNDKTSLRDLITYSDPLTPMLQSVLEDFATSEDDQESRLVISENPPEKATDNVQSKSPEKTINAQDTNELIEVLSEGLSEKPDKTAISTKNKTEKVKITQKIVTKISKNYINSQEKLNDSENSLHLTSKESVSHATISEKKVSTQSSMDSILPNNQEALMNHNNLANSDSTVNANVEVLPKTRKRQVSSESEVTKVKKGKKIVKDDSYTDKQILNVTSDANIQKSPTKRNEKPTIIPSKQKNVINEESENVDSLADKTGTNTQEGNPCLQSVSLFAEQFSGTKYNDSDSEETIEQAGKESKKPPSNNKKNLSYDHEVVVVKSNSNSESTADVPVSTTIKSNKTNHVNSKLERNKALANLFGFSSGGLSHRNRKSEKRKPSYHKILQDSTSESSEWTSESDSDYVSPPRSRRSRHKRKYLKPRPSRLISFEEDGRLFVLHGKKIYPVIKSGPKDMNYVTYSPESDPEDGESYWKMKYAEEKRKYAAKLALLKASKKEELKSINEECVPVKESRPIPTITINDKEEDVLPSKENENRTKPLTEPKDSNIIDSTVKISFKTELDKEVQLECHWSKIQPVIKEVVGLIHMTSAVTKNQDVKQKSKTDLSLKVLPSESLPPKAHPSESLSSGVLPPESQVVIPDTPTVTPDVDEVHEKVNKLEKEIFKEIEMKESSRKVSSDGSEKDIESAKKDLEPVIEGNESVQEETYVTLRRGRRTKNTDVPVKNTQTRVATPKKKALVAPGPEETVASGKSGRTSKRKSDESATSNESKGKTVSRKKKVIALVEKEEEDEILYRLPSPILEVKPSKSVKKSAQNNKSAQKKINKT